MGNERDLLKKFKESHKFLVVLVLADLIFISRYVNINFCWNLLYWKKSTLTFSYIKSNFKLIKKVCKTNADAFCEKKQKYLFHDFSSLFGYLCLVWGILSSLRLLSSVENSLDFGDFYPVWKLLSSTETFIQCVDIYLVRRLLYSADTFV